MANKPVEDSFIDYENFIRIVDPSVIRDFLLNIIDHIEADDGRVASITFKNGITHRFQYKV